MFQIDSVLGTSFFGGYRSMSAIVEDHAVLQNFYNRGAFVISSSFQYLYRSGTVYCNTTCKEMSTGTKSKFCRMEWIFYGTVRR